MPISLTTPTTIVIDKLKIDAFSVSPESKSVTIQFSKGHEDADGKFVPKEYDRVDLKNVDFDATLYSQVKDVLYNLLLAALAERSVPQEK